MRGVDERSWEFREQRCKNERRVSLCLKVNNNTICKSKEIYIKHPTSINCLTNSPQIVHTQLIDPQIPIFTIQTRSCPIALGFTGAASIAGGAELYSSIIGVVVICVGGVVGGPVGGGGGGIVHLLLAWSNYNMLMMALLKPISMASILRNNIWPISRLWVDSSNKIDLQFTELPQLSEWPNPTHLEGVRICSLM